MLEIQRNYLEYLNVIKKNLEYAEIENEVIQGFSLDILNENVRTRELTIPVVGAFSAGKSSLINSFLGGESLPVAITPETSLATELRYSSNERIEAIKSDNSIETFNITEMKTVTENASKYKYIRLYLNNNGIRSIEPLVLVDMPGFDSPLDLHNQAIMEYLNRGVHYIILTSVEDGNITRSMTRQLLDIQEYGRDFSFFLSKSDLRADSEVREIASKVEEQIYENLDLKKKVISISKDGGNNLASVLSDINPELLFNNLFTDLLKENYYKITEYINTLIIALQKDKNTNEDAIENLKKSLNDLLNKKNNMIEDANSKYSDSKITYVVESLGRDLSNSIEELVTATMNGGSEALSSVMFEIIRHSLVENVQSSMKDIGNDVIDDFSSVLTGLNSSMSDFTVNEDWVNKISESAKILINSTSGGLNDLMDKGKSSDKGKAVYKAISTVLAITTTVLAPVVEIILIFLPELIGGLLKKSKEKKQKEELRSNLSTQIIPSIKRELRTKLPEIFQKQVGELIQNISAEFESVIQEKQAAIEDAEKVKEKNIEDVELTITKYKTLNDDNTKLANNTIFI